MFCPLEYRDTLIIFRGLFVLAVVILVGVSVAEGQLNSLTQRQESVHALHITCDHSGTYSLYLLGSSYHIKAVYPVGEMINHDKGIIIKIANHSGIIPTKIDIDCKKELVLLDSWARLLVEEALKFKHALDSSIAEMEQRLHLYMRQFR